MPEIAASPYHAYGAWLRRRFGRRVIKIPVDAGFSCPNRDGRAGEGGCVFCVNAAFSPAVRAGGEEPRRLLTPTEVREMVADAVRRRGCGVSPAAPAALVYFQPYSNTYAPVDKLQPLYESALTVPGVIGLAIGTRPDCLDADTIDLLAALAKRSYIQLELGLPTVNDATLARLGRGHDTACFAAAMDACCGRGFDICAHMIAWLPGESAADSLRTAAAIAAAGATGIKIHHLHILRGSPLAADYARAPFRLPTMAEHVALVADILAHLPWHITIQRLAGYAPAAWTIAPDWTPNARLVPALVAKALTASQRRQGCLLSPKLA